VVLLQTRQGMSSDLSSLAAVRPDFFEDASSGQDDFATATSSAASAATVGSAAVAPMSLATSKTVDAASSATPQGVHLPSALSLEKLSSGLQPAPGLEDDTSADWTALRNGIEAGLWAAAEADRPALKLPESALQTVAAPAAPEVQQAEPDVDRSGSSLSAFASLLPKPGRSAAHSSGMHNEKAAAAGPSHRAGAKDVRAPPVLIQPLQEALAQKTEKVAAKKPLVRPMAPSRSSPPATVHHKKATNVPQVAAAQPLESASHEGLPAKTTELLDLETAATAPEAAAEMPVHYRDTSASGQEVLQHAWSSEQDLMQQMQTGSAPEAGAEMPVHYREARASGGAWSSERDLMQQQQMLEQLQHQQMLSQQQMVQQPQLQDWLQQPQPAPIQQQLLQQPPQLQEWPQQAPMKGAASFAQAEQQVSASLTSEAEMCQPYCGLPDYIPVTCQSYCTAGSTAGYMAPNYAVPVAAAPAHYYGPHADECTPQCTWKCETPRCDEVCSPICKAPRCETRCQVADFSSCGIDCEEPHCAVVCPHKTCPTGGCPMCATTCSEPTCKLKCPGKQSCYSVCEQPDCEWKCTPPTDCPAPSCHMVCEQPRNCAGGTYRQLPPAQPWETTVAQFTGAANSTGA